MDVRMLGVELIDQFLRGGHVVVSAPFHIPEGQFNGRGLRECGGATDQHEHQRQQGGKKLPGHGYSSLLYWALQTGAPIFSRVPSAESHPNA
jgi:hypothetical protein